MYHFGVTTAYVTIYNYLDVTITISYRGSNVRNLAIFCRCVLCTGRMTEVKYVDIGCHGRLVHVAFSFFGEVNKITLITTRCDDYVQGGCRIPPDGPPCLHVPIYACVRCYEDVVWTTLNYWDSGITIGGGLAMSFALSSYSFLVALLVCN
jgi:hypothetical protein